MPGDGTTALAVAHRYWSRLEDGMNLIAAAAIFFLMFVGVFQIIGRTAFNTAIYGYIDYMEQASALFAFLGISYAQRVGAHIRMDLLLRGVVENLRKGYSSRQLVVTLSTGDEGVTLRGRVVPGLPGSVIATLRSGSMSKRGEIHKRVLRFAVDAGLVVQGKQELSVAVKDEPQR